MTWIVHTGDNLDALRAMPDNSVDSVCTDPPYGLGTPPDALIMLRAWLDDGAMQVKGRGFMGKEWDAFVPQPATWREVYRVLKPGGHLLTFAGTRTQDLMALSLRIAGFEIRDMLGWLYGCLSADTELLIDGRWEPYHKAIDKGRALCYIPERDEYQWQTIQELVEYDYDDTAFRIRGDYTDQIVSRNHRCLVERGGGYAFALAETLERETRVPILENLQDLLDALPVPHEGTGDAESILRDGVRAEATTGEDAACRAQGACHCLPELRQTDMEAGCVVAKGQTVVLQQVVPGENGDGPDPHGQQVRPNGDEVSGVWIEGRAKPSMEGRRDLLPKARQLQADQVCPVPCGVFADGQKGRVCHGAPAVCCACDWAVPAAVGSGTPSQPRPAGQPAGESGTVRQQSVAQAVRGAGHTRSDLAQVEPFHYRGKVWCIRVPSGAFVARRNGKVFVTGNSGFPKSLDVSKAIDKAAGAEREVVGKSARHVSGKPEQRTAGIAGTSTFAETIGMGSHITAPATEAARKWHGWGTALKPAIEPITLARKPLDGTVAANVLRWGTGGLNVDGCRVGTEERPQMVRTATVVAATSMSNPSTGATSSGEVTTQGRWPANILHDGSPEVEAVFPQAGPAKSSLRGERGGEVTSFGGPDGVHGHNDNGGSAARFFYSAKTAAWEREIGLQDAPKRTAAELVDRDADTAGMDNPRAGAGRTSSGRANIHPTVKGVDVMRWLVRLITPPGGTVLDPYTGSGTTGMACVLEGLGFVGCELSPEYADIARARIAATEARQGVKVTDGKLAADDTPAAQMRLL